MGVVATISRIKAEKFEVMRDELKYPHSFEIENVYLGKYWDIMAYTLVGSSMPIKNNLLSEIINPQENYIISENEYMKEYLKYIPPGKVKQVEKVLDSIGEKEFKKLFNERSFIFKGVMYDFLLETDNFLNLLTTDFLKIKELFKKGAEENNYIVTVIS